MARQHAREQIELLGFAASFLDCLYDYLREHVRQPPSLEQAAGAFAMSPATLKRKLHKHHTGFQQQVDRVRKQVALHLYQVKGYSNDEVAAYLNFNDAANFRRSFKRWTGSTPNLIRQLFNSHWPGARAGTPPAPAQAASFAGAADTPPTGSGLRGRIRPVR